MEFKLKEFKTALNVPRIANIHYFEFTNEYHTESDAHPFRELIYVDSGSIEVKARGYSGKLYPGQAVIHCALEPHSLYCFGDVPPSVIIIGFECECSELDRFSKAPANLSEPLQKILTDIIREGRTVFEPPYDLPNLLDMKKKTDFPFGADQMIRLKLEEFLILLIRSEMLPSGEQGEVINSNVAEVCSYLNENYTQNISLDELCFLFGTNKTTLCMRFKESYGITIISYINKKRIKRAKELMRSGKYSMSEIAAMTGFSSVHYFSRIFKNSEHHSPTEYLKTIKSKLGI